jgi:transposase
MISRELEAEILRLYTCEHWPIGTLARQLHVHHDTVRRVLGEAGIPAAVKYTRPSMVEPYVAFIQETLARYPSLRPSRLYQMVRERGYPGAPDHFRAIVARYRPRPAAEAYLRLRTLMGEQGQADWAHFGKLTVGRAARPLMAFVMVLSYSHYLFLRFYLGAAMSAFLDAHVRAFTFFQGVPRTVLYDNLRSAVLERMPLAAASDAIRFHPRLLELSAWYRFAARTFTDLADLNAQQALTWCEGEAAARPCPEDRSRTVRECFEAERPRLLTLPAEPFPAEERLIVRAHKTPYPVFRYWGRWARKSPVKSAGDWERSVLHRGHGFCTDAGSGLLWQAPAELREQQLLIWFGLRISGEDQFAPIGGGKMDVEQLHGGEFFQHDARRESRCTLLEELFECDLQTVGHEGDEDMRLDPLLVLMVDGADRQVTLQIPERSLDLG